MIHVLIRLLHVMWHDGIIQSRDYVCMCCEGSPVYAWTNGTLLNFRNFRLIHSSIIWYQNLSFHCSIANKSLSQFLRYTNQHVERDIQVYFYSDPLVYALTAGSTALSDGYVPASRKFNIRINVRCSHNVFLCWIGPLRSPASRD